MSIFVDHPFYKKKKHVIMHTYHSHPYLEIYYLKDGARFYVNSDGKMIKLHTGDFLFVPPDEMHLMKGPVSDSYNVKIDMQDVPDELIGAINKCIYEMDTISVPGEQRKYIENQLDEIFKEFTSGEHYDKQIIYFMTVALLVDVTRIAVGEISPFDEEKEDSFEKTLIYINENYNKQLSIDALAAVAKMSKSYFSHTFKKRVGISPIDYINKLRVNAAGEYILTGELSTNEIAQKTGFKNASYFCATFKKYMGITTNDYKAMYSPQITENNLFNVDAD